MTLRVQLALVLIGLTALSTALIGIPELNLLERALLGQERVAAQRTTELLADSESQDLVEMAERCFAAGLVERVRAYDETGELVWDGPASDPVEAPAAPPELGVRIVDHPGHGRYIEVAEARTSGGTLVAWYALTGSFEQLTTARLLIVLYGGLAAMLVLIIGFLLLSRMVVRPVRLIRVAAERVAAGDRASRLNLETHNEIGDLAISFNHMLDRLEDGRRELEQQVQALEAAKSELEQAQSAVVRGERLASVGRLAAGVAHEVGNPLSAVLGLVELMREEPEMGADERDGLFARLERELLRMHETIRGLLDYSRVSDDEIGAVSVAEVVEQAESLVLTQPDYRDVELVVDVAQNLPLARANADRLLQVLVNLLFNAADAVQGRGRVSVSAAVEPSTLRLAVADSGPGIPSEVLGHIFEPFFTTKPPGKGTGLGLAITESIVQGFGGEVEVDGGGDGRGATFTLRLTRWVDDPDDEDEDEDES